jgi:hypothetical protein
MPILCNFLDRKEIKDLLGRKKIKFLREFVRYYG